MEDYVKTRLCRNAGDFDNMIELSHHPDLTLEVLRENPNRAWGFHTMETHPNFTFDWVLAFPNKFWNWNGLSKVVDLGTILQNQDMFWNWSIVTDRATFQYMMDNPDAPWEFGIVFIKNIGPEHIPFLNKFSDRIPYWKWSSFVKRTDWKTLKDSMHLPWVWYMADVNMDENSIKDETDVQILRDFEIILNWVKLTILVDVSIINANPDLPWARDFLQWNRSSWSTPVEPIEKCVRQWVAANAIKRQWRRSISDPSYKICRDRLRREFKELVSEESTMASVSVFKLRPDAIIPSKATPGAIGLDLHSVEPYIILPGQRVVVSTGIRVQLPDGVYGRIAPRSGLAVKHGLDVGAGVVDPDYDGEIRVVLFNHDSHAPFIIRPGYRIAQLILEKALDVSEVVVVTDGDA